MTGAFRHFVQQVYNRGAEGLLTGDEGLLRQGQQEIPSDFAR